MNIGDLLAGTISGPEKAARQSVEISWNGTEPVEFPGGIKRTFSKMAIRWSSAAGPGQRLSRRVGRGRGDDLPAE